MKRQSTLLASVAVFGAALFAYTAVSAATPDETITARRASQKEVLELVKSVSTALKSNAGASSVVDQLTTIADRAQHWKAFFPEGTGVGNTRARPEVWTNRAKFDSIADSYAADFAKALTLAKAGDTPGLVEQFKKATGNCDACHTDFRSK
jgi:cytochrome c556